MKVSYDKVGDWESARELMQRMLVELEPIGFGVADVKVTRWDWRFELLPPDGNSFNEHALVDVLSRCDVLSVSGRFGDPFRCLAGWYRKTGLRTIFLRA